MKLLFLILAVLLTVTSAEAKRRWIPKSQASVGPLALAWQSSGTDATAQTTYTFSSLAIGAAVDRDYVVAVFYGRRTTTGSQISSATIGGVTATFIGRQTADNAGTSSVVEMWYAAVPSGTTATFAPTFNGLMARAAVSVYAIKNASSMTPTATTGNSASATTLSLNTASPAGDSVIVAGVIAATGGDENLTWTGLTERDDLFINPSSAGSASGAFSSSATNTITAGTVAGPSVFWVGFSACFK